MSKTIIITGASSGIGMASANHLASLGHTVIAVGRNKDALHKLQLLYPAQINIVIADLTNEADWLKISNAVNPESSGVYFVHSAGVAVPQLLANLTVEEWDKHYLVNTKSLVFLVRQLLPNLKNGGRVLNISTELAGMPLIAMASYGITKAASLLWKEYANVELNKEGIFFGTVMPGVVDTPIQENLRSYDNQAFPSADLFKGFFQRNELTSPATVAKFIAWLLLNVDEDEFASGSWDIYDDSYHAYWATEGEVKLRKRNVVGSKA